MKLNLKKINYHKWIPSRFSSFQAKLLIAFLVATLLPLTLVALVSYQFPIILPETESQTLH